MKQENALTIFENEEFGTVRTCMIDGDPYFVGKDVADVLGYVNSRAALARHVDEDDKGMAVLDTPGGKQELVVINEAGFYSLILSSKLPSAKRVKRRLTQWVTTEVLPSLYSTGYYCVSEDEMRQYATEYINAHPDVMEEYMNFHPEIIAQYVSDAIYLAASIRNNARRKENA